jgi:type II secretory pathway component PulF
LISEKSDMASTWTAFGLLYDAGVPPYECAKIVKRAGRRVKSQEAWSSLESNFLAGLGISEAVDKSLFPPYIVSALKAADSSGSSIPEEVKGITVMLEEDVTLLTERFQMVADLWIKLLLAGCVFLAAQVTILPYLRMVISNA